MLNDLNIVFTDIAVTFLEMHVPSGNTLTALEEVSFSLLPKTVDTALYRSLYSNVGEKYHWLDRLILSEEELYKLINSNDTHIFIINIHNKPAGYVEFVRDVNLVEIQYFGLFPEFTGKGYGKYFLRWAIQQAWSYGPRRIQLNTCGLDHPYAPDNYKKNGFTEVRTETQKRRVIKTD